MNSLNLGRKGLFAYYTFLYVFSKIDSKLTSKTIQELD